MRVRSALGHQDCQRSLAIIGGIGGAMLLYWILNKLAESIKTVGGPGQAVGLRRAGDLGHRGLPDLPRHRHLPVQLRQQRLHRVVGFQNYVDLLTDSAFHDVLFNNVLWIIVVPGRDGRARPGRRGPGRPAQRPRVRRRPRRSSSCRWRSAWWARRRSGGRSTRTSPQATAPDRRAQRGRRAVRLGPVSWYADRHPPPQQHAVDGHPDLDAGRVRDGAALGGDQGRARRTPSRPPGSTVPASAGSSSASSSRRSGRRSSPCSSPCSSG